MFPWVFLISVANIHSVAQMHICLHSLRFFHALPLPTQASSLCAEFCLHPAWLAITGVREGGKGVSASVMWSADISRHLVSAWASVVGRYRFIYIMDLSHPQVTSKSNNLLDMPMLLWDI